jgi:hypothetical protein
MVAEAGWLVACECGFHITGSFPRLEVLKAVGRKEVVTG